MPDTPKYTDWDFPKDTPPDQIDWDNIEWLIHEQGTFTTPEGTEVDCLYIHRHPDIPQFGGLVTILAYSRNFQRYLKEIVRNPEEFLENANLFDIGFHLARGGRIPMPIGGEQ